MVGAGRWTIDNGPWTMEGHVFQCHVFRGKVLRGGVRRPSPTWTMDDGGPRVPMSRVPGQSAQGRGQETLAQLEVTGPWTIDDGPWMGDIHKACKADF